MSSSLLRIQQKTNKLQIGLLRFRDKQGPLSLFVKVSGTEDTLLNCVIEGDSFKQELVNRNVNFIQKSYYDYIFITGTVTNECQNGNRIISIQILKAFWFVRRSTENFSWLKEKYAFESPVLAEEPFC